MGQKSLHLMDHLKRIVLRSEQTSRLKELGGYDRKLRVPEKGARNAEKVLGEVAADDIRRDVEKHFSAIRERMRYKRKDFEVAFEEDEGRGLIRTPDFQYTVSVHFEEEPGSVVWRREVDHLKSPEMVRTPDFQAVFGDLFDTLVCEFTQPPDIMQLVDRIEERDSGDIQVDYDSQCSWCEISVHGFPGKIRVEGDHLKVAGATSPSALAGLLSELRDIFGGGEPKALT